MRLTPIVPHMCDDLRGHDMEEGDHLDDHGGCRAGEGGAAEGVDELGDDGSIGANQGQKG